MASQQLLFTVLPRAMAVNTATLPVSVFVSPRLAGANRLDAFPDWRHWTASLADHGLRITLKCGTQSQTLGIDPAPLRPALWDALFKADTFVRSHAFDDYTDRGLLSYSARAALSVLKSTYQQAGIALALPDRTLDGAAHDDDRGYRRRTALKYLLKGLAINWNEDQGESWRRMVRAANAASERPVNVRYPAEWLAADGTFDVPPDKSMQAEDVRSAVARQFGVYSHLPQGEPLATRPQDFDTLVDFHQALASLNSYPELLRALGLVFDFDLPLDLVPVTGPGVFGTMAVVDVPGRQWAIATTSVPSAQPVTTAYLHWNSASPAFRLFTTAPAVMQNTGESFDVFGLLLLEPGRYGIAQVDLESGLQKATLLAEAWQGGRPAPAPPDRPDVFDETTTLPSLRSGGFSIFADGRALRLARSFARQKELNGELTSNAPARPLFAEDLVHGYRVDVWDGTNGKWHSLHRRTAHFDVNGVAFDPPGVTEGFAQLAAAEPAPGAPASSAKDLYLNESMARWAGWSLSVPFPGKALSHEADPAKALDDGALAEQNAAATPFKIRPEFKIAPKSLPALRFGRRYRFRLRAVDLAGNSLRHDDPVAELLGLVAGLPRDADGLPYLRFEPVDAPVVALRDPAGVTAPGSQLERLVIRTFNSDVSKDGQPAVVDAGDRHILPPSTSVEMAERLGMLDLDGAPNPSTAMYALIAARDKGRLPETPLQVGGGDPRPLPLVTAATIDTLPYLPDVLSRGAALRDLPGAEAFSVGRAAPGAGPDAAVDYQTLADANPRTGSATLVSFGEDGDWQKLKPFRLALADGDGPPRWNPVDRVLTVALPKGTAAIVPLSSFLRADDLKLMGVWQWLREAIDRFAVANRAIAVADARFDSELVAHILQRAQEGGHWMLTPPRLLTLVHAVQQPIGIPRFTAITVQHAPYGTPRYKNDMPDDRLDPDPKLLQTVPESTPAEFVEGAAITAWRRPDSTDAFLLGGLELHVASTDRVDFVAEWTDPRDDADTPRLASDPPGQWTVTSKSPVDEVPVPSRGDGVVYVTAGRGVAYLDADRGVLCMARAGDRLGQVRSGVTVHTDAAPRHRLGDTRRHRIDYTARATSRFREYFDPNAGLEFARDSAPVTVDVPASARPLPPIVNYVVPTFAWQRQTDSNVKRSIRFGGGLRIFLDRPWFSSGLGELLGVALYDPASGAFTATTREQWKAHVTQWGGDPIWMSQRIDGVPARRHLLNAFAEEESLTLPRPAPGRVDVAGYEVAFDFERQKWYADIAIDTGALAYTPFVRLALVRYQPVALADAKLSAPVLADFMQLTPERAAVVSADPYHPLTLRVTVSGPAPTGPLPQVGLRPSSAVARPTQVTITVQEFDPAIGTDLGWRDAPALATVTAEDPVPDDVLRWTGRVTFAKVPEPAGCRLLIREFEYLSANWTESAVGVTGRPVRRPPKRLIFAETVLLDSALIGPPTSGTGTTVDG